MPQKMIVKNVIGVYPFLTEPHRYGCQRKVR